MGWVELGYAARQCGTANGADVLQPTWSCPELSHSRAIIDNTWYLAVDCTRAVHWMGLGGTSFRTENVALLTVFVFSSSGAAFFSSVKHHASCRFTCNTSCGLWEICSALKRAENVCGSGSSAFSDVCVFFFLLSQKMLKGCVFLPTFPSACGEFRLDRDLRFC